MAVTVITVLKVSTVAEIRALPLTAENRDAEVQLPINPVTQECSSYRFRADSIIPDDGVNAIAPNDNDSNRCLQGRGRWLKCLEQSTGGSGSSPWVTTANVIHPDVLGDAVSVGSPTALGKFSVQGDTAGEITTVIRAAAAQTADVLVVEDSGGVDLLTVAAGGEVTVAQDLSIRSGTAFDATFSHGLTADRAFTIPDASGTLAVSATTPITLSAAGDIGFDQTADLDNNARVVGRLNSGADVGPRRALNFIEGTDITITVVDDVGNEEIEVTITSTAAAGSSPWTDATTHLHPTDTTDHVTLGSSTLGGMLFLDGLSDEVQLQIQAASGQSVNPLVNIQTQGGADRIYIDADLNLVPNVDDGISTIGTADVRWRLVTALEFAVYNASGDTNPAIRINERTTFSIIEFGRGAGNSLETGLRAHPTETNALALSTEEGTSTSAVHFVPILDDQGTIGTEDFRWDQVVANNFLVYAAAGDANASVTMVDRGTFGMIQLGPGGGTNLQTGFRAHVSVANALSFTNDEGTSTSAIQLLPHADSQGDIGNNNFRFDGMVAEEFRVFGTGGDAQPIVEMRRFAATRGMVRFGVGGATATQVALMQHDVETEHLTITHDGGTDSRGLFPLDDNDTNALLGNNDYRWNAISSVDFDVFGTAGDTQPILRMGRIAATQAAIDFGLGGVTAPSARILFVEDSVLRIDDSGTGGAAWEFDEASTVPGGAPGPGFGRLWVLNSAPNVIVYTDDTGVDHVLNAAGGITGSGVDNQVAIFDSASSIDSSANLTFSASTLGLNGGVLFTERADHTTTPAATFGEVWVRSDAPNMLVFTDDDGTDHDLFSNVAGAAILWKLVAGEITTLNGGTGSAEQVFIGSGASAAAANTELTVASTSLNPTCLVLGYSDINAADCFVIRNGLAGADAFRINGNGDIAEGFINITPEVINQASGVTVITLVAAAHTDCGVAQVLDVDFDLSAVLNYAAGSSPTDVDGILVQSRTYTADASLTITNVATVRIDGAATASTNVTITNNYALWVDDDDVRFDGDLLVGAVTGVLQPNARVHVHEDTLEDAVLLLESTATNDDPNFSVHQGRIATTDATVTTINTIPITASRTYRIEVRIVARRTGGSAGTAEDGAAYTRIAAFKTVGGTVTKIGSGQPLHTQIEDQAGWTVALNISGTNVVVQVTGAVNNNITWHSTVFVSFVGS